MRVIILGCGPTGLLAAHELYLSGIPRDNIVIISKKRKSQIYGAQYLHEPIEGISVSRTIISYKIWGDRRNYLRKVYGEKWDGTISDELRESRHYAWDIRAAYDELWGNWENKIIDGIAGPDLASCYESGNIASVYDDFSGVRLMINTIPRPALCDGSHQFKSTKIWASGDAPDQDQYCPIECPEGDVIYNGEREPSWYRASRIFGHTTAEWPWNGGNKPPYEGIEDVEKPLSHNCTCWPSIHHIGRFGKWQNGTLVHHTIRDVQELLLNGFTK